MDIVLYLVTVLGLTLQILCDVIKHEDGHTGIVSLRNIKKNINHNNNKKKPQDTLISSNKNTWSRTYPNCSNVDALVCLDVQKRASGYAVIIKSCPNVSKVRIQLTTPGQFQKAPHSNPNNIKTRWNRRKLLITKPRRRQVVLVSPQDVGMDTNVKPRIVWQFKGQTKWNNGTIWRKGTECISPNNSRVKRSSKNDGNKIPMNDLKNCGTVQSCIRFGTKDCRHLECEYLLTYKIVNHTILHLEISGKTNGWVALGLSSDNKMGGDDVIACKLRSVMSDELLALSMATKVAHSKPQAHKFNELNLVNFKKEGEFIYCKMTRMLGNGHPTVDLTNNWFQFYARGDIDRNGFMLKHTKTPPTSLETITMLRPMLISSIRYDKLSNSAGPLVMNFTTGILLIFSTAVRIIFKIT